MNLLIFVTSHVPHYKVNVIGVSIGLEASFRRGKTIQDFAQSVQIFVQPPLHDFFEVHVFPLSVGPRPSGFKAVRTMWPVGGGRARPTGSARLHREGLRRPRHELL